MTRYIRGAIESENEVRWYTFTLSQKSTVTIFMQVADTMDADLYICSYDFTIVGGSASEGAGVSELAGSVLDSGTYYLAIEGYEGIGNFAFMYFQSSVDADCEINDSTSSATNIALNSSIVGVIDSPIDIDYYKLTVTNTTIMRYSISSSMEYSLVYAGKSGDNAAIYAVNGDVNMVKMLPGTYYFAVLSEDDTDFYSIHCRCTGAYDMNNFWDETSVVQVLIDPSTGKLIDIVQFNYYYDFAPVGTNYITITRPYTMTFYQ